VKRAELTSLNRTDGRKSALAGERVLLEKHYRVRELGQLMGLSDPAIRDLFRREEGVIFMGQHGSSTKRAYTTMMIPASVVERVRAKLTLPSDS
jgi:hypothetical protein